MKEFLFNKWTCENIIVSLLCFVSFPLSPKAMDPGLLCGSQKSSPQNALRPPWCLLCWADKVDRNSTLGLSWLLTLRFNVFSPMYHLWQKALPLAISPEPEHGAGFSQAAALRFLVQPVSKPEKLQVLAAIGHTPHM